MWAHKYNNNVRSNMSIQKKTTIQDIARHANVSVGTVDRVLHNRGSVMPEKKERVEEAIKQLNYNPNALASNLFSN